MASRGRPTTLKRTNRQLDSTGAGREAETHPPRNGGHETSAASDTIQTEWWTDIELKLVSMSNRVVRMDVPSPMWASWIMDTSLAPSPMAAVIGRPGNVLTKRTTWWRRWWGCCFFNQENGQLKKDHKGHYDAELGTSDFCSGDMRQQTTATQRLATWASKGAWSRKASASEAPSTTRPTLAPGLAASFSLPGERNSR